ncbi:helix-turn-helix transcriptional regulator [Patescibacteria group bacterium]|nr:helix-turn-helix transcriptional regulator [Patescibacteria group bacterium]
MKQQVTNNLAELRKDANITQQSMADQVGVSRQTIISIEKGKYTPSVLLAIKIANVLSVRVENIFSLT